MGIPVVNSAILFSGQSVVAAHAQFAAVLQAQRMLTARPLPASTRLRTVPVFLQVGVGKLSCHQSATG